MVVFSTGFVRRAMTYGHVAQYFAYKEATESPPLAPLAPKKAVHGRWIVAKVARIALEVKEYLTLY